MQIKRATWDFHRPWNWPYSDKAGPTCAPGPTLVGMITHTHTHATPHEMFSTRNEAKFWKRKKLKMVEIWREVTQSKPFLWNSGFSTCYSVLSWVSAQCISLSRVNGILLSVWFNMKWTGLWTSDAFDTALNDFFQKSGLLLSKTANVACFLLVSHGHC